MPLRAAPRLIGAIALDAWLRDPAGVIPGNAMTFPGIAEERTRADLIAYLRYALANNALARGEAPSEAHPIRSRVTPEQRSPGPILGGVVAQGVSRPGYFWKSALAAEPGRSKPVSVSD